MPNGSKYHRTEANIYQSNAEPEAKRVAVVVWSGGEAVRQKGRLGGRAVGPHLSGGPQKMEKEKECSDIEKREGSGSLKSPKTIERGGGHGKNGKDSRRPSHGSQKGTKVALDTISECLRKS
jgi:hypothetical protein